MESEGWFVIGFIAFLVLLLGAGMIDGQAERDREDAELKRIQLCLDAGKEWVDGDCVSGH